MSRKSFPLRVRQRDLLPLLPLLVAAEVAEDPVGGLEHQQPQFLVFYLDSLAILGLDAQLIPQME